MAQFASDTFAGTEGTELSAYSASWAKNSVVTGSLEICSGRVRASSTTSPCYYHSGTPASADYSVSGNIWIPSNANEVFDQSGIGVVGRMSTTASTMYTGRLLTNGYNDNEVDLVLWKFVAGAATNLGSVTRLSQTELTAKNVKLEMIGSAIKVYFDGSATASISATDSAITAAGKAGVRAFTGVTPTDDNVVQVDTFSADDIGATATSLAFSRAFPRAILNF